MKRLVALAALLASPAARADPSNTTLVLVGAGLALPDYAIGVSVHEGSHAIMAKIVGATVDEVHLFPPGIDPHAHVFRFGWTYVHGLDTSADKTLFYLAPKFTDLILLGGFAALVYTGAWPHDRYGQLALTVAGTGLWVDFAKDVVLLSPYNDVSQAFRELGIVGWKRALPARLLYAAIDVGLAFVVARGYERTFDRTSTTSATATPIVAPVFSVSF